MAREGWSNQFSKELVIPTTDELLELQWSLFYGDAMAGKRVTIKQEVHPGNKRIGTIIESDRYRHFVKWSDTEQRWEYKVNIEEYVAPVVVGSRVTVTGQYITGGRGYTATLTPAVAKVVYLHEDGRAAVVFEHGNTLGVVYIKELEVII